MNAAPRVVLVTGASRGLGRAMAVAFGAAGDRVVINYRIAAAEALDSVRAVEAAGGQAVSCQADVREAKAVQAMVDETIERWRRLDVLICNAAVARNQLVVRVSEDDWDAILQTILTGTFHCLQAAGMVMQRQGGGTVVLVGSLSGVQGHAGQAPYAAAKAGLIGLMKSAAREWGPRRVRINLVLPGWHPTRLTGYQPDPTPAPFAAVLEHGTPAEAVGRFVVGLASMEHVSGQVFNLDSRIVSP